MTRPCPDLDLDLDLEWDLEWDLKLDKSLFWSNFDFKRILTLSRVVLVGTPIVVYLVMIWFYPKEAFSHLTLNVKYSFNLTAPSQKFNVFHSRENLIPSIKVFYVIAKVHCLNLLTLTFSRISFLLHIRYLNYGTFDISIIFFSSLQMIF